MKLLKKILVPVDFKPASEKAFETAITFANLFLSEITLFHVFPESNLSVEMEMFITDNVNHRFKKLLKKTETAHLKPVKLIVARGIPFERIIEVSEREEIDLVIVGAGNDPEETPFKLGTTVENLMHKNQIPLFVVKNEGIGLIKKILCPVDFSESSKRALHNAVFMANRLNASLIVLNVFAPVQLFSYRFTINEERENELLRKHQQEQFDLFLTNFHFNESFTIVKMVEGEPGKAILAEIDSENIDLLVMGTTGKSGLSRIILGSVTEKVTRELPCSFIVTNEKEISENVFESNLKIIESLIIAGRNFLKQGDVNRAMEKFSHVLNQYPDNIPALTGLIACYSKTGDLEKAEVYRNYARRVIEKVWGEEFSCLYDSI